MKPSVLLMNATHPLLLCGLLLLGLFPAWSHAQISYQSSDFAAIGDSFLVSTGIAPSLSNDFTATGPNFSWNYDTLPSTSQRYINYTDPNDAGYKIRWCAANLAFFCNTEFNNTFNLARPRLDSIGFGPFYVKNITDHYFKSDSALEAKMIGGTVKLTPGPLIPPQPLPIEYPNSDTIYRFPLAYTNADSSVSNFEINLEPFLPDSLDFRYVYHTKRVNVVEGWGSLVTPYDSFPSVLKMRTIIEKRDTAFFAGDTFTVPLTTVSYKWFDPAYGVPVLQADGIWLGDTLPPVISNVTYIDSFKCITPTPLFAYLPVLPYYDVDSGFVDVKFFNLSLNTDSVHWDFGDGGFSSELAPTHRFHCPGTKFVTLTAFNTKCSPPDVDTVILPVFILDSTGTYFQQVDTTLCDSDSIFLEGAWQHTAGTYRDTFPAPQSGCDIIVVTRLRMRGDPFAGFAYFPIFPSYNPDSGFEDVNFVNLSLQYDSVQWDFGDGSFSSEAFPTHRYFCPGEKTITLVTYNTFCDPIRTDTATLTLTVLDPLDAFRTHLEDTICAGDSVFLENAWQTTSGIYRDTISAQSGCDSIIVTDLMVKAPPLALFAFSPLIPSFDPSSQFVEVNFTNLSLRYDSVHWDFGDGNFSSDISPTHQFSCPGTQAVTLVAYNTTCDPPSFDSITLPVLIFDFQDVFITDVDTTICSNDSIFLENEWRSTSGFYRDTLTSVNGCDSVVMTNLSIRDEPFPLFAFTPLFPSYHPDSPAVEVNFINLSLSYDSVRWDFGDGNFSSETSPTHPYQCPGTQLVTLVTYQTGCSPFVSDTIRLPLTIQDPQGALQTEEELAICSGDSVLLANEWQTTSGTYESVFSSASGCDSVVTTNLTILEDTAADCQVTSISADPLQGVKIYPIPTRDLLVVELGELQGVFTVEVYNLMGQLVHTERIEQNRNQLDLGHLSEGSYLLTLRDATYRLSARYRILID